MAQPDSKDTTPTLPRTLIVMGVSGCGKSLIGAKLAKAIDALFEDADDFHPASNKAKMSSGIPLTDEDRWPWYRILRDRIVEMRQETPCYVLACSALKEIYRKRLRDEDRTPEQMLFVYLRGSHDLIAKRLSARKGHFMPSGLLDSQFATLEVPQDALTVDIDGTPDEIVADIVAKLHAMPA